MGVLFLEVKNKNIGFALTASFFHVFNMVDLMRKIIALEGKIIPIMSFNAYHLNTRLGNSQELISEIEKVTNKKIIYTIQESEELGLHNIMDILLIAPATRQYNS